MSTQTEEPKVKINCLTHLLELWSQGHRFTILYNNNHCIGVNNKSMFELGSIFKMELLGVLPIKGGNAYLPIQDVIGHDVICKIFDLRYRHSELMREYFDFIKKPV